MEKPLIILGDLSVLCTVPKVIIKGINAEELEKAKDCLRKECFKSQIMDSNVVVYDGCDRDYMRRILVENTITMDTVSLENIKK